MKILHVINVDFSLRHFLVPLMRAQRDRGHEVVGACAEGRLLDAPRAEGFRILAVPMARSLNPLAQLRALAALVALWLRRTMLETESFVRSESDGAPAHQRRQGTLRALLQHPRALLSVVGLTMGGTVAFYTYTTYVHKFLVNSAGLSSESAARVNAGTLFVYMLLQPVVGALSDRIGRRPVLIAFGVLGTLLTVPILDRLQAVQGAGEAFWLVLAALVVVSGYTAINAVVKAELFPVEIRALGVGLPYAITVATFGGTAEYVA